MSALSAIARQEYHAELSDSLPPPALDEPEHNRRRVATAIETFEALRPGDAYEARLAVQIVLCGAHATECLREAGIYRDDDAKRSRCRAQANSLMRAEHGAQQSLARQQKLRLAEAEAEAGTPAVQTASVSALARQAATRPASPPPQPGSAPPPSPEAITQAEAFAEQDVVAAARIRHDRGVTRRNKAHFRGVALPTDPAVLDALVRGTSALLVLLDDMSGDTLGKAA